MVLPNLEISDINNWIKKNFKPLIIAGPCSAETEQQVLHTAIALTKLQVSIFRTGIWKPRTRPNSFEGVGEKGLKWLQKVKSETGLLVAVEVANATHVHCCLDHGIDILWLGARTTVNPFTVQEIADSLMGVDIPVLIKNPVNPDLELWIGAIERINRTGIKKIVAVHRGFSTYEKSIYRNKPNWEIPLELKRIFPQLPLVCDPSHICGNRQYLNAVSQKSSDLAFDGLMIETHIDPHNALSDSEQQITPHELEHLLRNIIYRNTSTKDPVFNSKLNNLRKIIDNVDSEIIESLALRAKLVKEIAEYKKENNITILQQKRWNYIINQALKNGKKHSLSEDTVLDLFKIIHRESIRIQNEIMNKDNNIVEPAALFDWH